MKKKRFLVVDDDEFARKLMNMMLKKINDDCEIVFASDGRQAVNLFVACRPDVVFMDLNMPKMSGEEAIEEIRKYDEKVPIVVVSADKFARKEQGANDFVIKPFSMEHIESFCSFDEC